MNPDIQNIRSPSDLASALDGVGYLCGDELAVASYLALKLRRPIFCEGEPGVGKTSLALSMAAALSLPLFRLQCYEGLSASQALYDWDFPKQLLHARSASSAQTGDPIVAEARLYDRRFLLPRAILQSFEASPSVLLIDEIDRADDELEAFLLEALSEFSITVPELGTIRPAVAPYVVVTSNRTRDVHDALKRRCIYHWINHPSESLEIEIVRRRCPDVTQSLATDVVRAVGRMRSLGLLKPPGVAESLDWARSLVTLGVEVLNPAAVSLTLGSVIKYQEDSEVLRKDNFKSVLSAGKKDV